MSELLSGLDASYGTLTAERAKKLRDVHGIKVFCECLWTGGEQPPPRVTNLRTALNAGLIIAGYISVTGSHDGFWHVAQGCAGVPHDIWDALALVFIDVELDGIPNRIVREAVETIDDLGKRRAIYTSYNAWVNKQGDPHDFTDCLLWNAGGKNWDKPDLAQPPTYVGGNFDKYRYGGWATGQVVGEQWSGGKEIEGINVDRDLFSLNLLVPPVEDTMTDADKAELYVLRVLAGLQEALAQKRVQDAVNGAKKFLGVVAA